MCTTRSILRSTCMGQVVCGSHVSAKSRLFDRAIIPGIQLGCLAPSSGWTVLVNKPTVVPQIVVQRRHIQVTLSPYTRSISRETRLYKVGVSPPHKHSNTQPRPQGLPESWFSDRVGPDRLRARKTCKAWDRG